LFFVGREKSGRPAVRKRAEVTGRPALQPDALAFPEANFAMDRFRACGSADLSIREGAFRTFKVPDGGKGSSFD
jgi:hypothetical protein